MQVLARARCHGATVIGSTVLKADANSSVSTTTITSSVTIDRATVEACKVTGREQHVERALLVAPQLVARLRGPMKRCRAAVKPGQCRRFCGF